MLSYMDAITATEQQLKTLKAGFEIESQAARDNLRGAAIACENIEAG